MQAMIHKRFVRAALALLFPLVSQAADFTVGTATARNGQKATGYIAVPAGADAAASVPVIVINGARQGPVLALVAGSHGTEYASILALQSWPRRRTRRSFPAP